MTDDDQGTGDPAAMRTGEHHEAPDDRRDVRSEADGALPEDKPAAMTDGERPAALPDGSADGAQDETGHGRTGDGGTGDGRTGDGDGEGRPGRGTKKQGSFWRELPVLVGVALVLALIIKAFAVQAFYIPSQSMENTLKVGDRVLVNKIVYHTRDVKRGDIVVFNGLDSWDPEVNYAEPTNVISRFFRAVGSAFGVVPGEKDYIKRVVGVPGDRVKCCDAQGRVTVNGHALDERSYLYPFNKPSDPDFAVTVPKGRLWVMGDHRAVSYDSRGHLGDPGGGTIPEDKVIGRAFIVVWPVGRAKILSIPDTFKQPALAVALPGLPLALGFSGALPITLLYRRWRIRRGPA